MHLAATTPLLDILLQIRIGTKLANVWSEGLIICEALANKVLGTVGYLGRRGEPNVSGVEHDVVGKDVILRLSISKGPLAKEHLIKDHANRPNINLVADANALVRQEALGGKVPVGTCTLTGKLQAITSFGSIHNLTQTEIRNLGISVTIK